MIPSLNEFVQSFKDMTDSHIDVYNGESTLFRKWNKPDFDISALVKELDAQDKEYSYSVLKRAYDVIRAHHRAFNISIMTRNDYYRFAVLDRERDKLIIDNTVNNLDRLYDSLTDQLNQG